MVASQDVPHCNLVDGVAQVRQRTLVAAIPPRRILFGHTHDKLLHFLDDTRPAQLSALHAPVKLLGDESLIPAQEGVWRGKGRHLLKALAAEWVGERREPAAFRICEPQPAAAEVGFEEAILFLEISNDVLLVTLEPAGDQRDEDVQDHEVPRVKSRAVSEHCSILPTRDISIG